MADMLLHGAQSSRVNYGQAARPDSMTVEQLYCVE